MAKCSLIPSAALVAMLSACTTLGSQGELAANQAPRSVASAIDTTTLCADIAELRLGVTKATRLRALDEVEHACTLPTDDITLDAARAALGGKTLALRAEGDTLTLFQIAAGNQPGICCSLQRLTWRDLGDGQTFAARMRLTDLQSGMLKLTEKRLDQPLDDDDFIAWRGPNAPQESIVKAELDGTLSEHMLFSPELGETRKLLVYTPPAAMLTGASLPAIYLTDGGNLAFVARLIEPLIESRVIAPVLAVGMLDGQDGIVEDRSELGPDIRSLDYLPVDFPDSPPSRFDRYLRFVTETLVPWTEAGFGASPDRNMRAVTGQSNGGVFALHAGYRRPDIFAHAWPMSPGVGTIDSAGPAKGETSSFRISAGYYEPGFFGSAQASAATLATAGYSVDIHLYAAGHMSDQWHDRLLENLKTVFPGTPARRAVR